MFGRREQDPLRLRFEEVHRHRPRSLLSPFVQHDRADPPVDAPGELHLLDPGPPVPFCAVVADVDQVDPAGGLTLGLAGGPVSVLARWLPAEDRVTLEVAQADGIAVLASAPAGVPVPGRLAFVLNENQVTVLGAPVDGDWRPLLTERDAVRARVDLRDPVVLGGLRYAWGTTSDGPVRVRRVRAGVSGPVGVRDPQVVRRADGSPLVRDGKLYLTLTSAGLGFFQQAHWGVWTLDLADPSALVPVGALFSGRDGLVLGDHAGQIVHDEATGRSIVLVSSWGDHDVSRGVHIRHLVTSEDVLHGVHVLPTERLDLPTAASAWDPSLARVDGRWHLAFVECTAFVPRYTFHPALAVAEGPRYDRNLRMVAADTAREQTEGTLLHRFGGRWYVLASDGDAREYLVYDTDLRQVGVLDAPYGTNIPHPMVVRTGPGRRAPWWLVTFDGTSWYEDVLGYGTHGDLVVQQSVPSQGR
jgi:hypothetical protein